MWPSPSTAAQLQTLHGIGRMRPNGTGRTSAHAVPVPKWHPGWSHRPRRARSGIGCSCWVVYGYGPVLGMSNPFGPSGIADPLPNSPSSVLGSTPFWVNCRWCYPAVAFHSGVRNLEDPSAPFVRVLLQGTAQPRNQCHAPSWEMVGQIRNHCPHPSALSTVTQPPLTCAERSQCAH